jgi:uncharacterized membrane protein YtjA (UPF0391 family)
MLQGSIILFLISLLSLMAGYQGVADVTFESGRMVFFIFLAFSIAALILSIVSRKQAHLARPPRS